MTAPPPDLDALKALAEKASLADSEDWFLGEDYLVSFGGTSDTRFIAACHPQAILAWIAHTEQQDARIRGLEGALRSLIEKLDLISANPQFIGVFQMAALHNMPYSGPNYEAELKAARAALSTGPEGK